MNNNKIDNTDLQIISTLIFISATVISLTILFDEKLKSSNKKEIYTDEEALNISFNNRIVILIAVLISLYVSIDNYIKETKERAKYKSLLLLSSNILTLIVTLILLYVSYLNKEENTLTAAATQNTLI